MHTLIHKAVFLGDPESFGFCPSPAFDDPPPPHTHTQTALFIVRAGVHLLDLGVGAESAEAQPEECVIS